MCECWRVSDRERETKRQKYKGKTEQKQREVIKSKQLRKEEGGGDRKRVITLRKPIDGGK